MLNFDEKKTVARLKTLPFLSQLSFSLAIASRQLCNYERFARIHGDERMHRPRMLAMDLWTVAGGGAVDFAFWKSNLDEIMSLMPEDSIDGLHFALADDALSSLAYTIRFLLNTKSEEIGWAARRALEAADQAAIIYLQIQPRSSESESLIDGHVFVQRELARQNSDLTDLEVAASDVESVKRRALASDLLTDLEAHALVA